MSERLIPVGKYNPEIQELSILKRIEIKHPLLVRDTVAKKLGTVASNLPNNLKLQIDSGYRSRESQERIWSSRLAQFGGNKRKTRNLVFDPESGTPPHTTGGAVDISLLDTYFKEINLSAPFEKFYIEPQLHSDKISPEAQSLRILIHDLMLKQEFAPHSKEYWHFSYGDEAWAKYYKKDILYDEVPSYEAAVFSPIQIAIYKALRFSWRIKNKIFKTSTNY